MQPSLNQADLIKYKKFRVIIDKWSKLGEKIYPAGTILLAHTPHIAPLAYMHRLYAPLDQEGIVKIEEMTGFLLPPH